MTYEQSLDLAELQADMAFETYLSAFEDGDHPEVIDSLATEALIAQDRCADLRYQDLAHLARYPCVLSDPQGRATSSGRPQTGSCRS